MSEKKQGEPRMPRMRLRRMREQSGKTAEQIGRVVGVRGSTISRWELGRTVPHEIFRTKWQKAVVRYCRG